MENLKKKKDSQTSEIKEAPKRKTEEIEEEEKEEEVETPVKKIQEVDYKALYEAEKRKSEKKEEPQVIEEPKAEVVEPIQESHEEEDMRKIMNEVNALQNNGVFRKQLLVVLEALVLEQSKNGELLSELLRKLDG